MSTIALKLQHPPISPTSYTYFTNKMDGSDSFSPTKMDGGDSFSKPINRLLHQGQRPIHIYNTFHKQHNFCRKFPSSSIHFHPPLFLSIPYHPSILSQPIQSLPHPLDHPNTTPTLVPHVCKKEGGLRAVLTIQDVGLLERSRCLLLLFIMFKFNYNCLIANMWN